MVALPIHGGYEYEKMAHYTGSVTHDGKTTGFVRYTCDFHGLAPGLLGNIITSCSRSTVSVLLVPDEGTVRKSVSVADRHGQAIALSEPSSARQKGRLRMIR